MTWSAHVTSPVLFSWQSHIGNITAATDPLSVFFQLSHSSAWRIVIAANHDRISISNGLRSDGVDADSGYV